MLRDIYIPKPKSTTFLHSTDIISTLFYRAAEKGVLETLLLDMLIKRNTKLCSSLFLAFKISLFYCLEELKK